MTEEFPDAKLPVVPRRELSGNRACDARLAPADWSGVSELASDNHWQLGVWELL